MKIQLHDNNKHFDFAPLSLTRAIGNIRVGILTNDERWGLLVPDAEITFETEDYLSDKFAQSSNAIVVNATVIPNADVVAQVIRLKGNEELKFEGTWIARCGTGEVLLDYDGNLPIVLNHRWELFQKNGEILEQDFELITRGRTSVQLSSTNTIIGDPGLVFLEEGAKVEAVILNTTAGPIYIGENSITALISSESKSLGKVHSVIQNEKLYIYYNDGSYKYR